MAPKEPKKGKAKAVLTYKTRSMSEAPPLEGASKKRRLVLPVLVESNRLKVEAFFSFNSWTCGFFFFLRISWTLSNILTSFVFWLPCKNGDCRMHSTFHWAQARGRSGPYDDWGSTYKTHSMSEAPPSEGASKKRRLVLLVLVESKKLKVEALFSFSSWTCLFLFSFLYLLSFNCHA